MATNQKYVGKSTFTLPVIAGVVSGDPVLVGASLTGVAITTRDANGNATVDVRSTFTLPAKGVDQAGNSAIAIGDLLYFTQADAQHISKKNTGVIFGTALSALGSGIVGTVDVIQHN